MVDFVAVAVAFGDVGGAVNLSSGGIFGEFGGVVAEAHGAAGRFFPFLPFHDVDDILFAIFDDFFGIGVAQTPASGGGDAGHLHAEAETKIWYIVGEGVGGGGDFAVDAARAKTAGDNNTVDGGEVSISSGFGVDPGEVEVDFVPSSSGLEGFGDADISIIVADIFGDETDLDSLGIFAIAFFAKFFPGGHVGFGVVFDEVVENFEDAGFENVEGDVVDTGDIG